ncbi:UNVERIFIED_CONTAM: hypothetical protein Cloal_2984 [Acetivibrio alkalicellulosi]
MNNVLVYFRKTTNVITIIFASIFLFFFLFSTILTTTVMTSEFHKNLFDKNNIYYETQSIIELSLDSIIEGIKEQSPQLSEQQNEIIYILQNSISPQMINTNIDKIRDGIFQYFWGETRFLPDIYMDTDSSNIQNSGIKESQSEDSIHVFNSIQKISLNAIIMSINPTDIFDKLLLIRFLFFCINNIPWFSLIMFSLLFLLQLIVYTKNMSRIWNWLFDTFIFCSILFTILGIVVKIYSHSLLSSHINVLENITPFNSILILNYIKDCIFILSILSVGSGTFLFLLALTIVFFKRTIYKHTMIKSIFNHNVFQKHNKVYKYIILIVLFISIFSSLAYNAYSFKSEFNLNNYSNIISKYTAPNSVTQIVSAKNETIYTLLIKLVDSDTNDPIKNININVNGKDQIQGKFFNESEITDEKGTAKFNLRKGTFNISFSSYFEQYILPSPFLFDLNSVGTTIITINLDKSKNSYGIIEIEVIDNNNEPIKGIEVYLENLDTSFMKDIKLDSIVNYSLTNIDGLAVLKKDEGTYIVSFSENKFPEEYILPDSFEVNIYPGITTRYTIRLAKIRH